MLLRVDQPYSNHNGGQLQFGPDGRLYVGMGDGGSAGDPQNRAQNTASRLGKILRITLGTSPLKVGMYTKGMRNPWRFSFDRANGNLWIGDVGQNAWEEIDRLRAGTSGRRQPRLERLRRHARLRLVAGREAGPAAGSCGQ